MVKLCRADSHGIDGTTERDDAVHASEEDEQLHVPGHFSDGERRTAG